MNKHIFSWKDKAAGKDFEQRRIEEMDEGYRNPIKVRLSCHFSTEWRETAKVSKICSKHSPKCHEGQEHTNALTIIFNWKQEGTFIVSFVMKNCVKYRKPA